jgi:hypothetical protein
MPILPSAGGTLAPGIPAAGCAISAPVPSPITAGVIAATLSKLSGAALPLEFDTGVEESPEKSPGVS